MKKYVTLLFFLLSTANLYAQGRLGIQISPTISFGRVLTGPNNSSVTSQGAALRSRLGAIYDYPLQDNYNLGTGLLYSSHRFSIKSGKRSQIKEVHEINYLQVPLLLRFYTSEVTLDTRVYAELGITGQIKLASRNAELQNETAPFVKEFRHWGLTGAVGVGVEYDTNFSADVFAGISYQPGFVNIIGTQKAGTPSSKVMGYTDVISIDLGARF